MKKYLSLLLALCLTLSLAACGSKADTSADAAAGSQTQDNAPTEAPAGEPVELIVFAAASMTETMNQLKEMYEQNNPNVTVTYNFDSSGKLLTQIKEGADCDLFISAAPKQMNAMDGSLIGDTEKNPDGLDLIVTDSRVNLLENKVTLTVPAGNPKGIESFDQLAELLKKRRCDAGHRQQRRARGPVHPEDLQLLRHRRDRRRKQTNLRQQREGRLPLRSARVPWTAASSTPPTPTPPI
ncbi:MAG: molybdate ABC transporter substrate-binding protein [Dysosmobacter sp.]